MIDSKKMIKEHYDVTLIYTYRASPVNDILNTLVPLGIYYIAAFLRKSGYSVRIISISSYKLSERLNKIIAEDKNQIIGFSCFEDNYNLICNAIRYIKKRTTKIRILIGGPQTFGLGETFFDQTGCDIAIIGEGELTIKYLADYYLRFNGSLDDIPNIIFKRNGILVRNPIQIIENIDDLVYPDIEDLPDTKSFFCITGRGCPYSCTFCYDGSNSKVVRYRSIEHIIEEIDIALAKRPYIDTIHFFDDTFTLDYKRVHKLCQYLMELKKTKPIRWICEAHIMNLYKYPEMIGEMTRAGLESLHVGIESGSNKVLKAYGKNTTCEMIIEVIKNCKENNLPNLQGNIIVGGAWESQETIDETQELIRKLIHHGRGMIELYTTYIWPYPNTPITKCPEKFGLKMLEQEREHSIFSMRSPVMRTESMSRDEIIKNHNKLNMLIRNEIRNNCLKMTKRELQYFWDANLGKFTGFWGEFLNSYPHFVQYMSAIAYSKQSGDYKLDEQYPIRTFNVLEYNNNALTFHTRSFEGLERKILELSTGKYSIIELSHMCQAEIKDIIYICNQLHEQCLLYFSEC